MVPAPTFKKSRGLSDVDEITETINLAFSTDPTWAPVLTFDGDLASSYKYWRLFVNSAARFPWTYTSADATAVAVWYPPGADELTSAEEAGFPDFVEETLGSERAKVLFQILEGFEKATPTGDFFYLSLLAVHPKYSGSGLGMQLLSQNLQEIDALGKPSFLESSNPANDYKYERLGYQKHGKIELPSGITISTFWRDPQ